MLAKSLTSETDSTGTISYLSRFIFNPKTASKHSRTQLLTAKDQGVIFKEKARSSVGHCPLVVLATLKPSRYCPSTALSKSLLKASITTKNIMIMAINDYLKLLKKPFGLSLTEIKTALWKCKNRSNHFVYLIW